MDRPPGTYPTRGTPTMDEDVVRRLVKGILVLVLTSLATWLAGYITDRILGPEELEELE
jgi:hypothetical protein